MISHVEATFWQIFRTLGTPNEKIWPGYAKLPGVKVNFVKQPYVCIYTFLCCYFAEFAFPFDSIDFFCPSQI